MATRDTPWPPGTPCRADVSVDDVPKAMAFYQGLFGWDIQSGGPQSRGYAIAHIDGRVAAGMGPKTGEPGQPSRWLTYLDGGGGGHRRCRVRPVAGRADHGNRRG